MSSERPPHGPQHLGCPTCDPDGARSARAGARTPVTRVEARGEAFKVVQVVGNLFVCSRANGACCCGWVEKDRMPFDNAHWSDEWERRQLRNRVHLSFVGCLGPCVVGNNALLQVFGQSVWFKDLNEPHLAGRVYDYLEASVANGGLLPLPDDLAGHVYERYVASTADPTQTAAAEAPTDDEAEDALEGLDPVCLMTVDVATAGLTAEYDGRTFGFCGPGCRREFLVDPASFLAGSRS